MDEIKIRPSEQDAKIGEPRHKFNNLKSFDYDQITEEIFIGTNACCIVDYSRELLAKNILADISLEKERIDNPNGVDYFIWLPVVDKTSPTQKQMELGVSAIDFFVKNKIKFYAHCKNGHGRAPTLVAAYLITQGMTAGGAIEFLKSKRPAVHLNEVQIKALEDFSSGTTK